MKTSRQAFRYCTTLLALAGACATTSQPAPAAPPPPRAPVAPKAAPPVEVVFAPVATAKSAMVGSLVSVAPSKIVADLDALSKRLGLPVQAGQELLSSLGSLGLFGDAAYFRQVWERLDPSAAVAIVWVLSPQSRTKGYCAALTLKDAADAKLTLDELGKPGEQRDGVAERKVEGMDSVWGASKGKTLLVSNSAEALLLAGGLAEAAQVSPKDGQVVLSALPQALAKASGQSNDEIIARLVASLGSAAQAADTKVATGTQRMLQAGTESAARMALESGEVRLVLDMTPTGGILVRAEMVPLPGSDLATRTALRAPYAFDDRLPIRDDGTAVMAVGDLSSWFLPFARVFESSGPAGQAMRRDMTQWFGMVGDLSCVVEPVAVGYTSLCSSSLKPGTDPKHAVDAALALLSSQNAWEGELEGRKASPLKITRKRGSVEVEKKIENRDPSARAIAKAMAGGDKVKTVIAQKGGRLVQATGQKARDMVTGYGASASNKNAPLVAAALTATQGMEGVASVDVVSGLLRLLGKGKDLPGAEVVKLATSLPGVMEMKAPFVFTLRTGAALTGEFRIPLGSLDSMGKVVQGVLGAAGGPPPR